MATRKTPAKEGGDTSKPQPSLAPEKQQADAQPQAPVATKPAAPTTPVQERRQRPPLSQPVYRRELPLNTMQAQRVAHRSFAPLAGSLFRSDVILRIVGTDQAADELEGIIKDLMDPVMQDLDKSYEQAEYLLKEHGIAGNMPEYTQQRTFKIEIKSPQTATFARMIAKLDNLIACLDALWFNGLLTNKQRSQQTKDWQQRLLKMANRIINFETRARKRAYDAGMQDEVERQAPQAAQDADAASIAEALKDSEVSPNHGTERDDAEAATAVA